MRVLRRLLQTLLFLVLLWGFWLLWVVNISKTHHQLMGV